MSTDRIDLLNNTVGELVKSVSSLTSRLTKIEESDFEKIDTNKDNVISRDEWIEYAKDVKKTDEKIIATTQRNSLWTIAITTLFLLLSLGISTLVQLRA